MHDSHDLSSICFNVFIPGFFHDSDFLPSLSHDISWDFPWIFHDLWHDLFHVSPHLLKRGRLGLAEAVTSGSSPAVSASEMMGTVALNI